MSELVRRPNIGGMRGYCDCNFLLIDQPKKSVFVTSHKFQDPLERQCCDQTSTSDGVFLLRPRARKVHNVLREARGDPVAKQWTMSPH